MANSAFAVKKNGGSANETLSGSPSISNRTVTLTLATAAVSTDSFTVAYEKPTTGSNNRLKDAANNEVAIVAYAKPGSGTALEDTAGNEVASFTAKSVTNNTPDTTAPTFVSANGWPGCCATWWTRCVPTRPRPPPHSGSWSTGSTRLWPRRRWPTFPLASRCSPRSPARSATG